MEQVTPVGYCLFCETGGSGQDEKSLILYRGRFVFIQMNLYPYNPGHIMIAPYRHVAGLWELSPDEQHELIQEAARSTLLLRETMNADGFNLGINQGKAAGAGVEYHLHFHIVPRWNGDTNFMPVVADTKVIPEDLTGTYRKLAPVFSKTSR
ncbi:HIT family hydrolase [Candidatus Methylomirabilis lanthanidiphila]|uniref:HIT family hydrolase n=1 Tax=Candidatus Methylomirabilis lanthanidiphila TaxID=2211376 RepID=A0A564ZH32_9BACT|nr:HIT family hydrolase [Candidatus Methylomirabilis lanthanidiphila]